MCCAEIKCKIWDKNCNGVDDYACGGGSGKGWSWELHTVTWLAFLSLSQSKGGRVPAACLEDRFDYKYGPCG
ncbi:hypothetical protein PG994_006123 [Apiospora phragmitis]|uniref:Uncharacterized protein n=1 Tax=Apiospora phragmitis TaxID=2905665 RepID=A0ABR1VEA4_9PEZI